MYLLNNKKKNNNNKKKNCTCVINGNIAFLNYFTIIIIIGGTS